MLILMCSPDQLLRITRRNSICWVRWLITAKRYNALYYGVITIYMTAL